MAATQRRTKRRTTTVTRSFDVEVWRANGRRKMVRVHLPATEHPAAAVRYVMDQDQSVVRAQVRASTGRAQWSHGAARDGDEIVTGR